MSAIFGYTGNTGSAEALSKSLRHWQPDREAILQDDKVSLGALELFNVPESPLTPQPYQYKDLIVVADCRIDNREELAKEFSIKDISAHADIEYIALAYEKWGNDAPKYLVGDFAFAIWDKKSDQLFAARDHFGIKTLYYSEVKGELVFASEMKGILAYPGFKISYNEEYIISEFSALELSATSTFYDNIHLLPQGFSLIWKNKIVRSSAYWTFGERTVEIPITVAEQEAEFNRLAYQSVRDRLRSFRRLGAESSGGLDSTGIAAIAMETLGKGKEFYSFGYGRAANPTTEQDDKDDMDIVRDMCVKYGIEKYLTVVSENDLNGQEMLDLMIEVCDDYESNGVPLMSLALLKHAVKNDVGVMLSGWAGDQGVTCTAEGFFENLSREKRYRELWKDLRRKHSRLKAPSRFLFYVLKGWNRNSFYKKNNKVERLNLELGPLKEELIAKYNLKELRGVNAFLKDCSDIQTYFKRNIQYKGIEKRTCDHVLIGQHFRIEYRFPMLDVRLLEYIYSLPFSTIAPQGKSRYLFKKLVQPLVPPRLISMHKSYVATTPFIFKFNEAFLPFVREQFYANRNPLLDKYFAVQKLEKEGSEKEAKKRNKSYLKLYFFAKKMK
ncbi:MAG: asparagine synthase-related protein [Bacteroidetes bacterium]|nr:asparagine synthase-related protein [Bacteroidota bacterium]